MDKVGNFFENPINLTLSKNGNSFFNFFILYFKKMCSLQQLVFYLFLYLILYFSIGMVDFTNMYSLLATLSITIFFSFNYGLFVFNLKKSNIYERIRKEEHHQLKNYGSIILNIIILSAYIYIVLIVGLAIGEYTHFFKLDSRTLHMDDVYGLKNISYFWMYYSVLFIAAIMVSICFFVENMVKTVKTFFIIITAVLLVFLILELIFMIEFSYLFTVAPYTWDGESVTYQAVDNYSYFSPSDNTVYFSIGVQAGKGDIPYMYLAIFFPFFALQSIFYNSIYSLNFMSENVYNFSNYLNIPITETTELHTIFLPHLFNWNTSWYHVKNETEDFYCAYFIYSIYFLLSYFYISFFTFMALITRKRQIKIS